MKISSKKLLFSSSSMLQLNMPHVTGLPTRNNIPKKKKWGGKKYPHTCEYIHIVAIVVN
jgi:hypothetical protein